MLYFGLRTRSGALDLVDGQALDCPLFVLLGWQAVSAGGHDAVAEDFGYDHDYQSNPYRTTLVQRTERASRATSTLIVLRIVPVLVPRPAAATERDGFHSGCGSVVSGS